MSVSRKHSVTTANSDRVGPKYFAHAPTLIVIVGYRNPSDIRAVLSALDSSDPATEFAVLVAENGGSAAFDALKALAMDPSGPCANTLATEKFASGALIEAASTSLAKSGRPVHFGRVRGNLGYAGGINAWLRPAMEPECLDLHWFGVWILNPDTTPFAGALTALIDLAKSRGRGMVGSRIVDPETPDIVRTRGLHWRKFLASTEGVDNGVRSLPPLDLDDLERRLESPSGASFYVTKETLRRIGLMDENYFLYYEDLVWGLRAKRLGQLSFARLSIVPHTGGSTIGSASDRRKRSPVAVYYEFRNRIAFTRNVFPAWLPWTVLMTLLHAFEFLAVGAYVNFGYALRAVVAGLCGETGRADHVFPKYADKPEDLS